MSALTWRARLRLLLGGKLSLTLTNTSVDLLAELRITGPRPWTKDLLISSLRRGTIDGERRVPRTVRAVGASS